MIYPPILKSSQPAFAFEDGFVENIYFTLPSSISASSFTDDWNIQIRIVKQSNNQTIVRKDNFPDGIIYKSAKNIKTFDNINYYIPLQLDDLIRSEWENGTLYKVQLRFGSTPLWSDYPKTENFATWKRTQVQNGTFSEWSTVMLIKSITTPELSIINATFNSSSVITSSVGSEKSLTPVFRGQCLIQDSSNEIEDQYRFVLYDEAKSEILEDSE